MKIHVNLHQSQNPDGWCASIARVHKPKGAKVEISQGESIVYPNKDAAWNSIQNGVKKLDYENDEIYFNTKKVENYDDLESKVDDIE
jgi:hypothetical protein